MIHLQLKRKQLGTFAYDTVVAAWHVQLTFDNSNLQENPKGFELTGVQVIRRLGDITLLSINITLLQFLKD